MLVLRFLSFIPTFLLWIAVFHPTLSSAQTREEILARPLAVMQHPDINQDHNTATMTAAELVAWSRKVNKAAFDKLDTNGDDLISRDEYWAAEEEKLRDRLNEESPTEEEEDTKLEDFKVVMNVPKFKDYYATTDKEYVQELAKTWRDQYPGLKPLSIRQTLLQDGKDKMSVNSPARFSLNRDNLTSEDYYTLDGAISYEIPLMADRLALSPTVEAHISNQSTNERDSVTYALPLTWFSRFDMDARWVKRHYLKGVGSFNTDRQQDTETVDASLLYTVDIPRLGMGATLGKDNYPIFMMRPWIGLDYGSVNKTGGVPDLAAESSYLRLRADLEATLWLADNFSLNGRYVHYTFLNGLERSYNFAEISAVLYLDNAQIFSLGASYRRGESAPKFNDVDNATVWMGIKF
jgi:hypothetical protein